MATIAQRLFDATFAESDLAHLLESVGIECERTGWDYYDCSLEMYECHPDVRLNEKQQRAIFDAGFMICFVNHNDGWETHYSWGKEFKVRRGWRRRWVHDPAATTTRTIGVAVTPENAGYYEISYWPESWTDKIEDDKNNGYFRIVPDPLETK